MVLRTRLHTYEVVRVLSEGIHLEILPLSSCYLHKNNICTSMIKCWLYISNPPPPPPHTSSNLSLSFSFSFLLTHLISIPFSGRFSQLSFVSFPFIQQASFFVYIYISIYPIYIYTGWFLPSTTYTYIRFFSSFLFFFSAKSKKQNKTVSSSIFKRDAVSHSRSYHRR